MTHKSPRELTLKCFELSNGQLTWSASMFPLPTEAKDIQFVEYSALQTAMQENSALKEIQAALSRRIQLLEKQIEVMGK